jgi:Integrase core domain
MPPMQNGHVESFNGRLRDECLNHHWFRTPADAKEKIERWRGEYNGERPHSSLAYRTREEFAKTCSDLTNRMGKGTADQIIALSREKKSWDVRDLDALI